MDEGVSSPRSCWSSSGSKSGSWLQMQMRRRVAEARYCAGQFDSKCGCAASFGAHPF